MESMRCVGPCGQKLVRSAFDPTANGTRLKKACRECCRVMRDQQEERRAKNRIKAQCHHLGFTAAGKVLRERLERGEKVHLEAFYSSKPSEFEVQAFVYRHLREMGYNARGEVRAKGCGLFRLDIGIFERASKKLLLILEIKKQERPSPKARKEATSQANLYRLFGASVCLIWGIAGGRRFLEHVRAHGLPLDGWE